MPPTKITARTLQAALRKAQEAKQGMYVWDTELRGFGLRAAPTGEISWLFQYWVGGRWETGGRGKRITFRAPDLNTARKHAEGLRAKANEGQALETQRETRIRLHHERQAAKARERALTKLGEAVDKYVRLNSKPGRYWPELEATLRRELADPPFGMNVPVANVTRAHVRDLIEAKQLKHKGAARTLYAALSPFFKFCLNQEYITQSPLERIEAPSLPEERDRVLTDEEIRSFWKATFADDLFGPFYRLLLLTAQRREEVSGMQRDELDLVKAEWLIPKERAKNKKAHLVHLSPQALEIINARPAFIGRGISGYGKAKAAMDRNMGTVTDPEAEDYDPSKLWRVHDLRRTAATGMASLRVQPHIVDRVLNHVEAKLKRIYQRFEYLEERKQALLIWGAHVERLVSRESATDNCADQRLIETQFTRLGM